jgi:hypothetical protein
VIVLNHGRDAHRRFRPLGTARFVSVAGEDLQGWSLPANAMQVINSGASGAVFPDADGSGKFESGFEYAKRELSSTDDERSLVKSLGSYDAAVATQAASLLRARDPEGFERNLRSMIEAAPSPVAQGFAVYLEAWKESQTSR